MIKKHLFKLSALALGVSLALPAVALAINCNQYAEQAVAQQRENLRLKCGFGGPKWSMDGKAHYKWCKEGNRGSIAGGELEKRENRLKKCRARGGGK